LAKTIYSDLNLITRKLTHRQQTILRLVVKSHIETAGPVGSNWLKKRYNLGMSSATIRNEMSELESLGMLGHPFTSAGRIPTKLGYQAFVNELMETAVISQEERLLMQREMLVAMQDTQLLIRESSKLLSRLASLLGVVLSPQINNGVLERLEIVQISAEKVMFVISVRGGIIRTILMQVTSELKRSQLDDLVTLLNERLAGLTLDEIRRTCVPRFQDLTSEETGLVRLIVDRSSELFSEGPESRLIQMEGTSHILAQPEFADSAPMRELIELLDDGSSIVRLIERSSDEPTDHFGRASIRIGVESGRLSSGNLSIVSAPFLRSNLQGMVGVIGPTRMNYARMVALVEGMATLMSAPSHPELFA
jgi:heat-inducible transcriptional repressor